MLTQMEIVFPKAAGRAVYTWTAEHGGEVITSAGAAEDDADGNFGTPEEALQDLQGWLHQRLRFSLPLPDGDVLILRTQPDVYAVVTAS